MHTIEMIVIVISTGTYTYSHFKTRRRNEFVENWNFLLCPPVAPYRLLNQLPNIQDKIKILKGGSRRENPMLITIIEL